MTALFESHRLIEWLRRGLVMQRPTQREIDRLMVVASYGGRLGRLPTAEPGELEV